MTPLRADLLLLFVTSISGSIFLFTKIALSELSPFSFLVLRYGLGAVFASILFHRSLKKTTWVSARSGIYLGLMLGGGTCFMTYGLKYTDSGKAAFIVSMGVLIVPFLTYMLYRDVPKLEVWAGLILSSCGLLFLTYRVTPGASFQLGDILLLISALLFSGYLVANSQYTKRYDVFVLTIFQLYTVASIAIIAGLVSNTHSFAMSPNLVWALLYLGLCATAIRFALQSFAQKHTTAVHASLIFTMEPIFASLYGQTFLGEQLTGRQWQGCALILTGCLIAKLPNALKPVFNKALVQG